MDFADEINSFMLLWRSDMLQSRFKGSESLLVITNRDGLITPVSAKILLQYTSWGLKCPLSPRFLDYLESDMQIPSALILILLGRGLGNVSFALLRK